MNKGLSLAELFVAIGADFTEFEKATKDIEKIIKPISSGLNKLGSALTQSITIPMAAAATAIGAAISSSSRYAKEIDMMSARTGIAGNTLEELRYVAGQLDFDFRSVETIVLNLTRRMHDLGDEGKTTGDAFQSLKFNARDVHNNLKPMSELFPELIKRLADIPSAADRATLAGRIFGKGFGELLPLINAGSDRIEGLKKRFRDLGLLMGDEGRKKADDFGNKIQELEARFKILVLRIGADLIPLIEKDLVPLIEDRLLPMAEKVIKKVKELADGFMELPKSVQIVSLAFVGLLAALGPVLYVAEKIVAIMPTLIVGMRSLIAFLGPIGILVSILGGVLGAGYLNMTDKAEKGRAATEALKKEVVSFARELGNLNEGELKKNIAYYENLIKTLNGDLFPMMRRGNQITQGERTEINRLLLLRQLYMETLKGLKGAYEALGETKTRSKLKTDEQIAQEKKLKEISADLTAELEFANAMFSVNGDVLELAKAKAAAYGKALESMLKGAKDAGKDIADMTDKFRKASAALTPEGSIAAEEKKLAALKEQLSLATTDTAREEARKRLEIEENLINKMSLSQVEAAKKEQELQDQRRSDWQATHQVATAFIDSLDAGFNSMIDSFLISHRQAADEWDALWLTMKNAAVQALGEILVQQIKNLIIDKAMSTAAIAASVAAVIPAMATISAVAGPAAELVSIATFGGAAFAGTSAVLAGLAAIQAATLIPHFAGGGLAFGPTLAMVGDNPGSRSDPELIAPLSQVRGMMQPNKVHVTGEFTISGRSLKLVLDDWIDVEGRTV